LVDLQLVDLVIPGLREPLSLTVGVGRVRAVVIPAPEVARGLADAVTGVVPPRSGRAVLTQHADAADDDRRARPIGLVPADGGLLPHLTVLRNVVYARTVVDRVPKTRAEQDFRTRAADYGLDDVLDRFPYEITLGRRRMVGLVRALQRDPEAIVLEDAEDVPTWGALLDRGWPDGGGWRDGAGWRDGSRPADRSAPADWARPSHPLVGVATLLITNSVESARPLDPRPLVPRSEDPGS
jgi:hypothetical protein